MPILYLIVLYGLSIIRSKYNVDPRSKTRRFPPPKGNVRSTLVQPDRHYDNETLGAKD